MMRRRPRSKRTDTLVPKTPLFRSDVIDTGAQVIDAVPFGLLPTDVQQEIVDLAKPIKELDLQEVEDTLRAELAAIQERSEEHTSELQSLMRISYAVFCLTKKKVIR